jgi:membrane protease YdiL (CAAX protease family)
MTENSRIQEFITFPKTFEKYRWYKPILVFIIGIILTILFSAVLSVIFSKFIGMDLTSSILNGGYEILGTEMGQIFTDLGIIAIIPSLYIASRIVRDRPFSSYASSRGGWNFKLYLKALIIPFILYIIFLAIDTFIKGPQGTYHFSIVFLIISLILVPLQCIAEEYAYRGLIMQTFGSWFSIPVLAVALQAILFALSHSYNIEGVIEVLISGLIMGYFAWKTNGIEVSSALHTANNLSISIFIMLGLQSATSSPPLSDVAISIVFEIFLAAVMYYVINKTEWLSEVNENTLDA